MNFGPLIFLGIFFTMSLSWLGLVLGPNLQLGSEQPLLNDKAGGLFPQARSGLAQQGAEVYRANGCFYCHSQQIGPENFGYDIQRGWGSRRTVSADYLFDNPVMAGNQRIGPDLANIGLRNLGDNFLLQHIYNSQITAPEGKKSNMPSYPYLFEKRKVRGTPSEDALKLPEKFAPEAGYEIVPRKEALALVAYLKSLRSSVPPTTMVDGESKLLLPSLTPATNVVEEATNAPAATDTNAAQPSATNPPAQ